MNLKRLVYLSRQETTLTTKDIHQIIETSEKNNEANGLSGLLIYSKRSFLQVIEGDIYKLNGILKSSRQNNLIFQLAKS